MTSCARLTQTSTRTSWAGAPVTSEESRTAQSAGPHCSEDTAHTSICSSLVSSRSSQSLPDTPRWHAAGGHLKQRVPLLQLHFGHSMHFKRKAWLTALQRPRAAAPQLVKKFPHFHGPQTLWAPSEFYFCWHVYSHTSVREQQMWKRLGSLCNAVVLQKVYLSNLLNLFVIKFRTAINKF